MLFGVKIWFFYFLSGSNNTIISSFNLVHTSKPSSSNFLKNIVLLQKITISHFDETAPFDFYFLNLFFVFLLYLFFLFSGHILLKVWNGLNPDKINFSHRFLNFEILFFLSTFWSCPMGDSLMVHVSHRILQTSKMMIIERIKT